MKQVSVYMSDEMYAGLEEEMAESRTRNMSLHICAIIARKRPPVAKVDPVDSLVEAVDKTVDAVADKFSRGEFKPISKKDQLRKK